MLQLLHLTCSHLRSKEFISIHKSCVPHSRDTTKYTHTGVHSDVAQESVHIKQAQHFDPSLKSLICVYDLLEYM